MKNLRKWKDKFLNAYFDLYNMRKSLKEKQREKIKYLNEIHVLKSQNMYNGNLVKTLKDQIKNLKNEILDQENIQIEGNRSLTQCKQKRVECYKLLKYERDSFHTSQSDITQGFCLIENEFWIALIFGIILLKLIIFLQRNVFKFFVSKPKRKNVEVLEEDRKIQKIDKKKFGIVQGIVYFKDGSFIEGEFEKWSLKLD